MQRAFSRGGVLGSPADFAVDGDLFTRQIADPELQDFEQVVRPQGEEDIAKDIVRGRAVAQGDELPQSGELRLGEVAHVGEVLAVADHSAEGDEQHHGQ